jgi:hypothetical protein
MICRLGEVLMKPCVWLMHLSFMKKMDRFALLIGKKGDRALAETQESIANYLSN